MLCADPGRRGRCRSCDHRHRHHPEQPERRRDDPEQEPSGEPEEPHAIAPVSIAAIAAKIGYACCGTTALPRHLSRSTREGIPSATRPTGGSASQRPPLGSEHQARSLVSLLQEEGSRSWNRSTGAWARGPRRAPAGSFCPCPTHHAPNVSHPAPAAWATSPRRRRGSPRRSAFSPGLLDRVSRSRSLPRSVPLECRRFEA